MDRIKEILKKAATRPILSSTVALLLILIAWIIWETYQASNLGFATKTFWDWMELLVVPAALGTAGAWFTYVQKQTELEIAEKAREEDRKLAEEAREVDREIAERERETEREIALERQRQQTLENYLDRMKELLLDRNLGPDAAPEVKRLARTWTLNVLRELTAKRNRQVIQFLQESKLLGYTGTIDLENADLSFASLDSTNLDGTNLRMIKLVGASLRGAKLNHAILDEAILFRSDLNNAGFNNAFLRLANLGEASLVEASLIGADLHGAELRRANLERAKLSGTSLVEANLEGANLRGVFSLEANLERANLKGANLENAILYRVDLDGANLEGTVLSGASLVRSIITTKQLNQAVLSDKTIMPDTSSYEEWKQKQSQEQLIDEVQTTDETPNMPQVKEQLAEPASEDG